MKRVLSIDGGGIRGRIPVMVLAELERRTGKSTASMFDLISGTSTGGILALTLTVPDGGRILAPKYSAKDVEAFYVSDGPKIFGRSVFRKIKTVNGYLDEKYSSEEMIKSLQAYLGESLLSESVTKVLVSGYDLHGRQPFFFKSHKAFRNPAYNFRAWQAALATASAPSYFVPATCWNGQGEQWPLIDGGVFATNTAMCAYAEAKVLWPNEEILVVSLGCGEMVGPYDPKKLGTGELAWIRPLLDIMFQGSSVTVDYQMRQLCPQYYRLQAKLQLASDAMDDASATNLECLRRDAVALIDRETATLDEIAQKLPA